ncbi:MAG: transposase, partial [Methylococcales bacterium]|nr:transposase [Methylococcales bacterium]
MPIKRLQLANNEIYHIVVRGIEGRDIFINENDYYRAIHDIFEFNDSKSASWKHRRFNASEVVSPTNPSEKRLRTIAGAREPRDFIVNILAFCLMPNHIHFLLKQLQEGGISKFMQKMGTGYANYFNNKYER